MKLLHIYRDPKDVISSLSSDCIGWADQDVMINVNRLINTWDCWIDVRKKFPEAAYLELNLRELIDHPRSTLRYVCDYLGLAFEEEMLKEGRDKLHPGRWKRDIDGSLVKATDAMLSDVYDEIGRLDSKNEVKINAVKMFQAT